MDDVILHIKNLGRKYKAIAKIVLFGSRARGDFNEKSDFVWDLFQMNRHGSAFWKIEMSLLMVTTKSRRMKSF